MKNLLTFLICLFTFCVFSQAQTQGTYNSFIIQNSYIDSTETSSAATQKEQPDWFDILRTNLNKMEKSGTDTVLLDSVYTYQFYSPNDSVLVLKQYANYSFNENKTTLNRFIPDSLSLKWIHFKEDAYYYDDWGNDSLLISNVKDTINNKWVHDTKTEYDFDSNGNEIYYAFYRWNDSLNLWIGSSQTIRNYDDKNHLLLREAYSWDSDSNKWDMITKHEYAFDTEGNKILNVSYGRDWQTNVLMPSPKYEYEFDENGNKILDASYSWDKGKKQWLGTSKYEVVYDENGNMTLSYYYTWDYENDKWKYQQKSSTIFSESGNKSEVYFWNNELSQWYGHRKEDREFNANGQNSISIEYEWSLEDTIWYKKSKTEYSYYKPELYPSTIIYKWNRELNDWELDKKTDLGFDENDQLILEVDYLWNDSLNVWKGDYKSEIHYNSNGDRTETILYKFKEIKSFFEENIKIFSFDSDSLINKTTAEFCSEQISVQDTDFVEGTSSILWEYQIGELMKWKDGCKISIKNDKDLSNEEEFHFDFKVINPTNASFVVLFKETSGELWLFEDMDLLANTSQLWKRPGLPFYELELVANEDEENGILDLNKIDSVQFLIYDLQEENISGALLLDNLGTSAYQDTSFWNITDRFQKVYDDHGNLINEIYFSLYADTLKVTSQTRYDITYDANGNQTSYAEYSWNSYSEEWNNFYKTEWSYDDSNRVISDARYYWDNGKEAWYGNRKIETSYDKYGNETSKAYIYWDQTTNDWDPDQKDEYYFNNENERTKHVYCKWNELSEEWEIESIFLYTKYNYILDHNNNLTLLESLQWDENLLKWSAVEKYYFYYSTHQMNPTGILSEIYEKMDVRIYPNPFRDKLTIEINTGEMDLAIFDISGKKLMTRHLDRVRNEINLSELNCGLHITRKIHQVIVKSGVKCYL